MKKRLRVKEDIIRKIDYSKRIIFDPTIFKQQGLQLQEVTIPANTRQRSHFHKKQTEILYFTEGEGFIFFNDEKFSVRAGDAFVCEPGDRHYLWNRSDKPIKLVVFKINYSPNLEDTFWMR